mgnify:CR=1 FL=1
MKTRNYMLTLIASISICLTVLNSAAFAVTEFVTVVKVLDNGSGIVERKNGERWHIEVGPEASFFWRYEGKQAQIKAASTFCGAGARILLPEDKQEASVWNVKLIGNSDEKAVVRAPGAGTDENAGSGSAGSVGVGYERFRARYDGRTMESAIDGRFDGWKGGTVVKLRNGQLWRQKKFYYHHRHQCSPPSPKVTIYKLGPVYKMQIEGVPGAVEVEELK